MMSPLRQLSERDSDHLRILLIEDNPGDVRLVQEALAEYQSTLTFELMVAGKLQEGLEVLSQRPADVILLDLHLPDSFGYETFTLLRGAFPDVPVVVLSSVGNEDLAVKTVSEGAQDYLFKDNLDNPSLVVRTIRYAYGRFQIRREVLAAEARLRTVIESTSDAIIIVDTEGNIRFANPAAELFAGTGSGALIGRKFPFPLGGREETEVTVAPSEEFPNRATRTLALKTTSTIWDGKPAFCATIRDISERKRMETELVEARREAENAARMKSEFLANMSHEIRTPLNGVIGMTSLLLETPMNTEQREFVETIRSSGEMLLNVLNDILDLSKIEAGKVELEFSEFKLRTCVEESLELFAEQARQKGLLLTSLIPPEIPLRFVGDPWRLRQILSNLISNAIKFTAKGEVLARVSMMEFQSDGAILKFEIRDTGIGVSAEAQSRLFQPFSQSDSSMTRKFGGTGLGLAISKRLAEIMHGQIGVDSEVGQGSCFWVTTRFSAPKAGWEKLPEPKLLRGKSVLIACEEEIMFRRLEEQLGWLGMQSHWESDPERAQKTAAAFSMVISSKSLAGVMAGKSTLTLRPQWKQSDLYASVFAFFEGNGSQNAIKGFGKEERYADTKRNGEESPSGKRTGLILVAEDNTVNQKIVLKMLERLGYRADVVGNGAEVIAAAQRVPYDAILMDCQMPEVDGFEATRIIREREREREKEREKGEGHRRLPIIAMTAHALKGDKERCLNVGMDDYIAKPLKLESLGAILARWMPAGKGATSASDSHKARGGATLDEAMLSSWRELTEEGEDDFLSEVIDIFLDNTPPILSALRNATQSRDARTLKSLAHKLKGSSSNLGALSMAELCANLEELGGRGEVEGTDGLVDALESEFGQVRKVLLHNWHAGPPSSTEQRH